MRVAAAAVAVVGLGAVIVAPTGASAAIVTTPVGLSPGDQYRLAFVTSTQRNATSSAIADYNMFVDDLANLQPELLALGATWTAIGSTLTVDARDNTGTNKNLLTGVPIYLLDGTKIAINNADFWDGSILSPFNIFEDGSPAVGLDVWTGTDLDGKKFSQQNLGLPGLILTPTRVGFTGLPLTDKWIKAGTENKFNSLPFYALSSQLTVAAVPLPGALILFGSGLAFLAVLRRRNRSVRPA